MKKIITFILVLVASYFALCFLLCGFYGEELGGDYTNIITTICLIIYNIIILIKKLHEYNKNGEVSDVKDIVSIMTAIVGIKSSRDFFSNLATTPLMVSSSQVFSDRVLK